MIRNTSGRGLAKQKALISRLSRRETEVFCMMGMGLSTRDIADRLGCTVKTVESFIERAHRKLSIPAQKLRYEAVTFMRTVAHRGIMGDDEEVLRLLMQFRQQRL